ncbi:response regulator transcription factor [Paraburkholderia diazotrophica]|uniref:response regulator transcription factor n=1 Tax=Paraburkholderia diazotrophica TaxID=667676 RepID=UPI003175B00D
MLASRRIERDINSLFRGMNVKDKCIKVAIADDHPLVLYGLRKALENDGFIVTGEVSNSSQLMALLNDAACDVLITDYSMPDERALNGWRLLASVSTEYPQLPVLVYSEFEDPFLIGSLVTRGVAGIVSKREEMSEVVAAVRRVASGTRYFSPFIRAAREQFDALPQLRRFAGLTPRQMEVAGLMLCGLTVCETARLLHRRPNTISTQRTAACKRMGFSGESEMYRFAAGHGLWLDRSSADQILEVA